MGRSWLTFGRTRPAFVGSWPTSAPQHPISAKLCRSRPNPPPKFGRGRLEVRSTSSEIGLIWAKLDPDSAKCSAPLSGLGPLVDIRHMTSARPNFRSGHPPTQFAHETRRCLCSLSLGNVGVWLAVGHRSPARELAERDAESPIDWPPNDPDRPRVLSLCVYACLYAYVYADAYVHVHGRNSGRHRLL